MSGSTKIQIAERIFPEEIVEDILSRLPVDSLLKLRCVSKSWRSLIDSEQFIKFHLKKSTKNEFLSHHRIIVNPVLSRDRLLESCSWASLLEEPIANPFEFDDLKDINSGVNIVGCCNGLVCLIQDRGRFILWNPSTLMSMYLPMNVDDDKFHIYGFGYDESSNDYKVFTIVKSKGFARIYSLMSHSWKTVEVNYFPYGGDKAGKYVSGNLHWFEGYGEENGEIVSFDLRNEAFGVVEQPNYPNVTYFFTQTLGVMEGCLSVLYDYRGSYFDIWVMKEYGVKESWVNLYTIPNVNHPPLRTQEVNSFWKGPNGEVLLIYNTNLMIYCYDPDDDVFRCSRIIDIDEIMGEGVYVESLVSLGPHAERESF